VVMVMLLILDSAWSSTRGKVSWKGRSVDVAKAPRSKDGDARDAADG
jgi:hypothetical protein